MKQRILCMILALLSIFPLISCGKEPAVPTKQEPPQIEEPVEPVEPVEPTVQNPLTGLPMNPEKENNRPVAVMLNDLKAALPQLGVSDADLIYEVPAEGGITRMLAVFQDLDGVANLGSIRSTRAYYMELALGHDAILVHAGGSPEAYANMPKWKVDHLDGVRGGKDAEVFWRDPVRRKNAGYEHSMLTSGENLNRFLAGGSIRLTHESGNQDALLFAPDGTPENGTPAEHISVRFSNYKTGVFDYDKLSKTYRIGQYDSPYVDGNNEKQVAVTNVLVLKTRVSLVSGDSAGRLSVSLVGDGSGSFFCGGKATDILWSKPSRNDSFHYTLSDGSPLTLGMGKSYICIVSTDSNPSVS